MRPARNYAIPSRLSRVVAVQPSLRRTRAFGLLVVSEIGFYAQPNDRGPQGRIRIQRVGVLVGDAFHANEGVLGILTVAARDTRESFDGRANLSPVVCRNAQ